MNRLAPFRPEARLALAFVLAGLGAFLVWILSSVLLLVFGALVVAAVIHGTVGLISRHTPLNGRGAKIAAIIVLVLAVALFLFLLGHQLNEQFAELYRQMPALMARAGDALGIEDMSAAMVTVMTDFVDLGAFAGGIGAGLFGAFGALTATLFIVIGGIYFSLEPHLYRHGLLAFVPVARRPVAGEALDAASDALKRWMAGQLLAMVIIGCAVTLALMALGLPSALAIGVIAGILEFIPFLGPIIAAIPALLVALSEGEDMLLWVFVLYVLIQQIEGNVLVPIIQKRTVRLPPALGLFSIVAFGILFGPLGVVLATPLTIVIMVLVQTLWLRPTR